MILIKLIFVIMFVGLIFGPTAGDARAACDPRGFDQQDFEDMGFFTDGCEAHREERAGFDEVGYQQLGYFRDVSGNRVFVIRIPGGQSKKSVELFGLLMPWNNRLQTFVYYFEPVAPVAITGTKRVTNIAYVISNLLSSNDTGGWRYVYYRGPNGYWRVIDCKKVRALLGSKDGRATCR